MLKMVLIVAFLTSLATASLPESGYYGIQEVLVRYAPSSKQNGSAWDPLGGQPDINLQFLFEEDGFEWVIITTDTKENSGTSASWSSEWEIVLENPLQDSRSAFLIVKVWDSDTYQSDFMDSGRTPLADLVVGENTIECNYGARVTFVIDGPNNQGRIHP